MNASLAVFSYFSILYQLPREKSTLSGKRRNPPATGLRPAALPPLARGAFRRRLFRCRSKGPFSPQGGRRIRKAAEPPTAAQ